MIGIPTDKTTLKFLITTDVHFIVISLQNLPISSVNEKCEYRFSRIRSIVLTIPSVFNSISRGRVSEVPLARLPLTGITLLVVSAASYNRERTDDRTNARANQTLFPPPSDSIVDVNSDHPFFLKIQLK